MSIVYFDLWERVYCLFWYNSIWRFIIQIFVSFVFRIYHRGLFDICSQFSSYDKYIMVNMKDKRAIQTYCVIRYHMILCLLDTQWNNFQAIKICMNVPKLLHFIYCNICRYTCIPFLDLRCWQDVGQKCHPSRNNCHGNTTTSNGKPPSHQNTVWSHRCECHFHKGLSYKFAYNSIHVIHTRIYYFWRI